MSRYVKWSEKKIAQFEKQGRGKGTGENYQPWIEVTDISSRGDSRRVYSQLTNRTHHFLSSIEFDFFVLAEATPDIIDIREQFPLPRRDTLSIAAELGINHPKYPSTDVWTVMTCDFIITRERNGEPCFEAYNCKSTSEAIDARSVEKLEIQRRLFDSDGIPHSIVFDSLLPTKKIKNLKWIRDASLSDGEIEPYQDYYNGHCNRLHHDITNSRKRVNLTEYCNSYDARTGAIPGTGLRVVRMLLSQRLLFTDLNQSDLPSLPIDMFRTQPSGHLSVLGA
jgi:hypothetical protein